MAKNTRKKTGLADAPSLFDSFDALDAADEFESMGGEAKEKAAPAAKAPDDKPLDGGIKLLYEGDNALATPLASSAEPPALAEPVESDAPAVADDEAAGEPEGGDAPSEISLAMAGDAEEDGALVLARYASQAYLEYAMSVVKSRALPEVSDGQKPVQRRILVDMDRMGFAGTPRT